MHQMIRDLTHCPPQVRRGIASVNEWQNARSYSRVGLEGVASALAEVGVDGGVVVDVE